MSISLILASSMGLWEHLASVPEPKKNGSQRRAYLLLHFSGVLYPQMRPPTKQASRFRSTARTSRPSLISWDLVWPLVFKLLCHVSSNWYLTFSLLPPLTSTSSLLHFILCLSPQTPLQPVAITSVSQSLEQNQTVDLPCEGKVQSRC